MIRPLFSYAGNKFKHLANPRFVELVYGSLRQKGKVYDLAMGAGSIILNAPNGGVGYEYEPALFHIFNWLKKSPIEFLEAVEFINESTFSGFSRQQFREKLHKNAYMELRASENKRYGDEQRKFGFMHCAILTVLIQTSFNSLVRFGPKGYNVPVGLKVFDQNKVDNIADKINSKGIEFKQSSLLDVPFQEISYNDIIYIDPPYLVTSYKYGGWTVEEEMRMYKMLDRMTNCGKRFVLSNVAQYKGEPNSTLLSYLSKRESYIMETVDGIEYNSYVLVDGVDFKNDTVEVVIRNFK